MEDVVDVCNPELHARNDDDDDDVVDRSLHTVTISYLEYDVNATGQYTPPSPKAFYNSQS